MKAEAKIVNKEDYQLVNIYIGDQTFFFRHWGSQEECETLVNRFNEALKAVVDRSE